MRRDGQAAADWRRRVEHPRLQLGALALLLVAIAAVIYHETRGTSFLFDDWSWILNRRGGSLGTYLDPHNQHLSLIPIAIYKLLLATFGIGSYVPYRVVMIAITLLLYGLFYTYAKPRVGPWAALVLTALLALLGPGWEDILWPFQIGFVLSLCAAVGALLALERRSRRGDVVASALSAAALASSGVGIPVVLGIALAVGIEIARRRRPLSDIWILAVPVALYAAWWIGYQRGGSAISFTNAPSFIWKEAASVTASLFGRAGNTGLDAAGTLTSWGTPLLIALLVLLVWRLARGGPVSARVAGPATMLVTFWLATAVSRAYIGNPYASRYIYVGATFALLIGVELARGWRPRLPITVLLAAIAGIAIGSNVGELRTAGALLRGYGQATVADLGALQIGRPLEPAGYIAHGLPGYPLVQVPAHAFFEIAATLGNPAASVATIEADDEPSKEVVDRELGVIDGVAAVAGRPRATTGTCVRLAAHRPASFLAPRELTVDAGAAPVTVSARRFATLLQPFGTISAGSSAKIRIARDLSPVPWHLQLSSAGPASVCSVGGAH